MFSGAHRAERSQRTWQSEPTAIHGPEQTGRTRIDGTPWRVLIVEDDHGIRESIHDLLEDDGYQVAVADNGREAMRVLADAPLPDLIVLDLRMPVMDGWEFRALQRGDETLKQIPVVAISADRSAQAVAISADAYLRKPIDATEFLTTLERVIRQSELRQMSERLKAAERLASLGRLAAGVGHEINNPLAFAMLNLGLSLKKLDDLQEPSTPPRTPAPTGDAGAGPPADRDARITEIIAMLTEAHVGLDRIRQTVGNLQQLSRRSDKRFAPLDLGRLIDESISMAWNQIRHRARLSKKYDAVGAVQGDAVALGQVFLNLLVNAAQAIEEGNTERNEISVTTRTTDGEEKGIVVEIRDTGAGIPATNLARIFDPFFTTKPVGQGTGLGLAICRQAVADHGGRIEVDSLPGWGTKFRVFLPLDGSPATPPAPSNGAPRVEAPLRRGRILVIDDEPLIGRAVRSCLARDHDVSVAVRAADAFARLAAGATFDLILCDLTMPDISGPEIFATISRSWPSLLPHLVFMTGGAFTPTAIGFVERTTAEILGKPFDLEELRRIVRHHVPAARDEPA